MKSIEELKLFLKQQLKDNDGRYSSWDTETPEGVEKQLKTHIDNGDKKATIMYLDRNLPYPCAKKGQAVPIISIEIKSIRLDIRNKEDIREISRARWLEL